MEQNELLKLREFSASIPKQKNLALFFGRAGGYFIGNVKYFFIHCVQHQPELQSYFLSFDIKETELIKQQGLPALWINDPDAIDIMTKASLVISDDFSWKTEEQLWAILSEATSIQLWHGIPLKAIGFPEINSTVNMTPGKAERLSFAYSGYDAVVSTSPYFTETAFGRAFKAKTFVESGYPRNDILMRCPGKFDMINVDSQLYGEMVRFRKQGGKVVFFMPTFRDAGGGPFEDGALDLTRLSKFCQQNNILFICKPHPYLNVDNISMSTNIVFMNPKSDAYPLLSLCDVLLTDYSSVYFDFLLLDRPIIFYAYDLEDYITKNRELLFDFDSMTPGKKVMREDDLYTAFEEIMVNNIDEFKEDREKLRGLSFTHNDGKAAYRLAEYIISNYL
ncbi:CDP-glycerol--poly(glycerophosphate) glycerophosphotransferase [Maridesulfovibrio hydrothermalis]|uniref:CDP-glycerol:poly(Glycerophosphate) glycerophosphotransferase n=1 Tax=Maridesulfovibrio hydrothermalis AM13 = DSM 14728 TaxID=1121451 RepID=L0RA03_9BACT|nr:CDP-glycerol--poly(glycerophosphate) glycerophosphotransferase [Maridesulfovibrio hydrothermalis]CCO23584.1 CDP-glycerol:poly(Glycerophosphate) glycerophosphotransferase [Maridesulfovibrio hydrothermalis AM13 = DSM 14728]